MPDSTERTALYHQAQWLVVNDLPAAYVYHRISYLLHHEWVENIVPNSYRPDTNGMGMTKFFKVDSEKRERYKKRFR